MLTESGKPVSMHVRHPGPTSRMSNEITKYQWFYSPFSRFSCAGHDLAPSIGSLELETGPGDAFTKMTPAMASLRPMTLQLC